MIRTRTSRSVPWVAAGVLASTIIAVIDAIRGKEEVLLGAVLAGPLLAAVGASTVGVAGVAAYSIALAVALGYSEDIFGTRDHIVRVSVVAAASIAAVVSAAIRERRDRELAFARPQAVDAQRLRLALAAGNMGTWRWDLRTGRVEWDTQLEALFGLAPHTFDGSFDTYMSMLHPEDRDRAQSIVRDGMTHDHPWQFDYRAVWPDGSVHWLEGRGEPLHDARGSVIGAAGVTIDVHDRHRLLRAEQDARASAERSSAAVNRLAQVTLALAGARSVEEIGAVIVSSGVEALHADAGYFATVDDTTDELVMRAQSGYPERLLRVIRRIPLDDRRPGTEAIHTGEPIFIESLAERAARYPEHDRNMWHASLAIVPLRTLDEARAVIAFGFDAPRRFSDDDRSYIAAVVEACAQALRRALAFEADQASRARLRFLLDSSEQLSELDDPDAVVGTIARLAATRIGTWSTVVGIAPDGSLKRSFTAHRDPALAPLVAEVLARLGDGGSTLRTVLETGTPQVFHGLTDDASSILAGDPELREKLDRIGYAAVLLVPITVSGRRLAVLSIGSGSRDLLPADVELAVDLGRRGASSLERAQLWQASRKRLEAEHRTVELLQRTIVPERLPELPAIELAAAYRPAEVDVDVGGDWYDAFVTPDGAVMVVVGDVAGHGIEAASLMGRVRNALRAYAFEDSDPARVLLRVHRLLLAQEGDAMVTAFVARHEPGSGSMSWSRAGHPPPLIVTPAGEARFLDDVNGAPLGTMAREYRTATCALAPGALMVCYTDGLVERRDRVIDDGLTWLAMRVQEHVGDALETLCDKLVDDPFVPHPSPDDVCIVALRVGTPSE